MVKPLLTSNYVDGKKKSVIKFIGRKTDLEVGTYVFDYILNIGKAKADMYFSDYRKERDEQYDMKKKYAPLEVKKIKTDYLSGYINSVCHKLDEIAKSKTSNQYEVEVTNALVVATDTAIKNYMNEKYSRTTVAKVNNTVNRKHYFAGQEEGKNASIHHGISNSTGSSQLKLGR